MAVLFINIKSKKKLRDNVFLNILETALTYTLGFSSDSFHCKNVHDTTILMIAAIKMSSTCVKELCPIFLIYQRDNSPLKRAELQIKFLACI